MQKKETRQEKTVNGEELENFNIKITQFFSWGLNYVFCEF